MPAKAISFACPTSLRLRSTHWYRILRSHEWASMPRPRTALFLPPPGTGPADQPRRSALRRPLPPPSVVAAAEEDYNAALEQLTVVLDRVAALLDQGFDD